MHGDSRRADIAGDAVSFILQARPQSDHGGTRGFLVMINGCSDAPLALAQDFLHVGQDVGVDFKIADAPFLFESSFQAVEITKRLVHVGLFHLDIAHMDRGVALDDAGVGGFAHHLRIDLNIVRNVNHEIAKDRRRA